jgi:hypothetical protein
MARNPSKRPSSTKRAPTPSSPMPEVLLRATPAADIVTVPARTVLGLAGRGEPGGELFQRSVAALYGVAYTLKFTRKRAGGRDFKVGALEACWWAGGGEAGFVRTPRQEWRWQLRLAVPEDVDRKEVSAAIAAATGKKGGKLAGSAEAAQVAVERLPAGRWGRVLHLGPYADEGPSIAKVVAAMKGEGSAPGADHVEIYLNDPRRTAPRKVRTVLLLSLAKRKAGAVQARNVPPKKVAAQDLHVSSIGSGRPLVR